MPPGDDSDPAIDWGPDALTDIDEPRTPEAVTVAAAPALPELDTEKFLSLDFVAGRESGFTDGVKAALRALGAELLKAGVSPADASAIVRRVRMGAWDRG